MKLSINHRPYDIEPVPGETLADLLRKRLNLTGTKIGCEEAECGSCTVLVDDEAVLSCVYPAERAAGKTVLTIEGLSSSEGLHPLQQAFIEHGAVQCGFCTPGLIMTAYALLRRNPDPSEDDIRHALKDTLCRCGGYPSIVRAIQSAAHHLRTGKPLQPPILVKSHGRSPLSFDPYFLEGERDKVGNCNVVGTLQPRPDATAKVTGAAQFTDDLTFDGMLFAAVRRASVPHAFLRQLDLEEARRIPGVVAVLNADDLPGAKNHGLMIPDWPVLVGVGERVRYVGDAVAIVAAETQESAQQAAKRIETEFDLQPVVSDPVQARQPGAPQLHPDGNLLKHIKVRKGNVEQGFAEAEVILEHTFHTAFTDHMFLEPECSIAVPTSDGCMEIYVGSQIPYSDRAQVAAALGWSEDRVRVIGQLVGGGFGGKEDIAGQIHAALLANATGRAVKLSFDRRESLLVHPKRHATQIRVKIGAKRDGSLTAVETELYGDTGAYASLGEKVLTRATTHSAGPYEVAHVKADCYAMYTNNPPAGAFRGFGVTQSAFAIESMMDMLAEELCLDPLTLRRKNAMRVGSVTNTGQVLHESVGLVECIDRVEEEIRRLSPLIPPNAASLRPPLLSPKNGEKRGGETGNLSVMGSGAAHNTQISDIFPFPHLGGGIRGWGYPPRKEGGGEGIRAWGFAAAYKNTGLGGGAPDKSGAEVELYPDGRLEVRTSAAELGQGLVTVLRMIVAEELQVPPEQVRVLVMDTDLTPDGGPTTASRQTYVTGNAARLAAQTLRESITATLAERFDLPPTGVHFSEGAIHLPGRTLPLGQAVEYLLAEGREPRASYEYWAPVTQPLGQGGDMHIAYSFGVQAAEVEVNPITGQVTVLRVISANDVGRAVNPLGLQGQVEGGVMMGLGNALTEHFIVEEGRVVTDRMARYRIPSITHMPEIISIVVEHPTAGGPYGAKGVGELVSIPTTPAITNAIYNATGVRVDRLPVDQELIAHAFIKY